MLRDRNLAINTTLLTASGLAMRFVGMIWQVWLVSRIGEAGIGLFQLVVSVSTLAATVAVSGIRYTTTRLVSEELGLCNKSGAGQALASCMLYGLFFGLAAGLILMLLAEPLGFLWLGDARTVRPLMLIALEMPLTGIDAVMHGYFTAVGRVWKSVTVAVMQQAVTIAATAILLISCPVGNLEYSCLAITAGQLLGCGVEILIMVIVYHTDRIRHGIRRINSEISLTAMTGRMLSIALPLAATAYARSGLSTVQHLLVPTGLRASGLDTEAALAGYGAIQGMALPVILFPSCVMLAVAELIVPKLTEQQVQGRTLNIQETTEGILTKGFMFSAITAAVFLALGDHLGLALYDSREAGLYIQIFAWIVPIMYMDMLADGCLKGLGEMMFCMYVNIADAALSALLVWLTLPKWGIPAYLFMICFTETFNFLFSLLRLKKKAGLKPPWRRIGKILITAALAGGCARLLYNAISAGTSIPALIVSALAGMIVFILGQISPEEEAGRPASW